MAQNIVAGVFCCIGTFFFLLGTTGLIRMPDIFSRLHPSTNPNSPPQSGHTSTTGCMGWAAWQDRHMKWGAMCARAKFGGHLPIG